MNTISFLNLFWLILSVLVVVVVFYATVIYPMINRRREYKVAYFEQVERVFDLLVMAYKPETLNPELPGNPEAIKEQAQNHVDLLRARMMKDRRSNIPPEIDVSSSVSLHEWYRFVRAERAKVCHDRLTKPLLKETYHEDSRNEKSRKRN